MRLDHHHAVGPIDAIDHHQRQVRKQNPATALVSHRPRAQRSVQKASVAVGTALRPFGFGPPPAQIPASGITALGSYLGYVTAKRTSG